MTIGSTRYFVEGKRRRRIHDEEVEVHDMMQKEGAIQAVDSTMISTEESFYW